MEKQISLGMMRINNLSIDELENLINEALNQNITLFDHADIYGNNKCEELFGEVLKRNKDLRKRMIIQSKCGICNGYYDSSKEHIIDETLKSIKRLNCEYLDILLIHRPDALIDYKEVNEAFNYLYENGYVKEFGVSNMNPYQMELFKKYVKQPIKYNQVQFSIVHSNMVQEGLFVNMNEKEALPTSQGILEYCYLNDIKVQAWSSLMASWSEGTFIDNTNYPKLNNKLEELANKYNVSKNTIAIAWILRLPQNIIPIIGTTNINRVKEMSKAINITLTRKEWYELFLSVGHNLP